MPTSTANRKHKAPVAPMRRTSFFAPMRALPPSAPLRRRPGAVSMQRSSVSVSLSVALSTARLGEMVAVAVEEALRITSDPRRAAELAAQAVGHLLTTAGRRRLALRLAEI